MTKPPIVAVHVHIPAPRKPQPVARLQTTVEHDINDPHHDNRKLKTHTMCILTGCLVAGASAYAPYDLVVHLGPAFAGLPSVVQEIIDWLRGLLWATCGLRYQRCLRSCPAMWQDRV